jgi:uncharacterized protein YggE
VSRANRYRIHAVRLRAALGLIALLTLPLCSARAQDSESNLRTGRIVQRRLTVTGQGKVRVPPDKADITIGVVTEDRSSKSAANANAAVSQQVQSAMIRLGIAKQDIRTLNYSVQPVYAAAPIHPENARRPPSIQGYRVSNQVRVTVRHLTRIGDILDAATSAGSNTIESISFGLDDETAAEDAALRKAVADARRKADEIAGAAGVRIEGVYELNEGAVHRPYPIAYSRAAFGAENAATPVQPGESTVTAEVTIVYKMSDGVQTRRR